MTNTLPARPDLDHLRRQARQLLTQLRAGEPNAVARCGTHAPGLPVALSTAQLVIAREYGLSSWAQLKTLVGGLTSDGVRYDRIGHGYSSYRRPDPRIAGALHRALGDAGTLVNVGAGTGSYEPRDRAVVAIEPSTAMALQRDPDRAPAILGVAESLPLADQSADAAMAILTMHHWADVSRGLDEMRRVARRRVVLLTIDAEVEAEMWLFRDYVPEMAARDRREFPAIDDLLARLGERTRITQLPVPADCHDGFLLSFWSRPEALLDPGARAATSGFARMSDTDEAAAMSRLERDLADGTWERRNGDLRQRSELDVGLRLVTAEL